MMSPITVLQHLLLLSICFVLSTAKRNQALYCGACHALVDELQYAIESEDPREKLDYGFRIDPNGQQKRKMVRYAGSEVHLMELLEEVCDDMQDYAENRDPESKGRKYMRYKSRLQEPLDLPYIKISDGVKKSLEVACMNIIEDYEDDILQLFREKADDLGNELCTDVTQYCPTYEKKDEL